MTIKVTLYIKSGVLDGEDQTDLWARIDPLETNSKLNKDVKAIQILHYGPRETLAYLASRLPNAYAACSRVFSEMKSRMPCFHPKTIMDFGCGPGTGTWAAKHQWSSLESFIGIDISDDMLQTCKYLSSMSFMCDVD